MLTCSPSSLISHQGSPLITTHSGNLLSLARFGTPTRWRPDLDPAYPDSLLFGFLLTKGPQRAFTAGLDVQQASEGGAISGKGFGDPARKAFSIRRHVLELQDCVTTLADCEKPVIALLHGISYGLGKSSLLRH